MKEKEFFLRHSSLTLTIVKMLVSPICLIRRHGDVNMYILKHNGDNATCTILFPNSKT